MEKLKSYFVQHFEQVFVFLILAMTLFISTFIEHKIAFLNFYFLPVILAGYYLGTRLSVLGAVLCILVVSGYVLYTPEVFVMRGKGTDLYLHIVAWGSFLILSGAVVGKQHEKLTQQVIGIQDLNKELQEKHTEIVTANASLKDYSSNLESKVKERTKDLEQSKQAIEELKGRVEEALYSTMDASVVKLMIEGRLRTEKRKLSVMFSDLVGFTTYSEERSPELVLRDLNRYLAEMEPVLLNFRGHIDKYNGDGIMAEFGAPVDYEKYQLLSVLAALKMQERLSCLSFPWKMRIGIATGSSIVGIIGSKRQSYTSIGDVVNLAARLEESCPEGNILIDENTFEGVKDFVDAKLFTEQLSSSGFESEEDREYGILLGALEGAGTDSQKAEMCFKLSNISIKRGELKEALSFMERAVNLDSSSDQYKVAYAELSLQSQKFGKIKVKGRKNRVKAYKVIGLLDPLKDTAKIPHQFYDKYHEMLAHVGIPDDVVLPIEALDGCIGHSRVVAALSYAIADRLSIFDREKIEILQAAYLADLGKEIVPHHILNRKGNLTDEEYLEVKKHPIESVRKLKQMGYESEHVLQMIQDSHERLDGSGYPLGSKGEQISMGGRIIAVADSYDALTSPRAYREKWDKDAAIDELKTCVRNGQLDAQVVHALIEVVT